VELARNEKTEKTWDRETGTVTYILTGRKDVIRCPKDSIGETQKIGRVRLNTKYYQLTTNWAQAINCWLVKVNIFFYAENLRISWLGGIIPRETESQKTR